MCFNNGKGGCCMVAAILLLWLDLYGIAMRACEYASHWEHVRVHACTRESERSIGIHYVLLASYIHIEREREAMYMRITRTAKLLLPKFRPPPARGSTHPVRTTTPGPWCCSVCVWRWSHHCMFVCECGAVSDNNLCSFAITKAVPLIFIHQLSPGRVLADAELFLRSA